ncbi:hypothetical protein M0R45_006710 [Rubus argutus]|uniref:Uncharacterized protein n=1 Tax=Rubus argutus TaxID=59490 RepID=A0AAW1YRN4_RUBAR
MNARTGQLAMMLTAKMEAIGDGGGDLSSHGSGDGVCNGRNSSGQRSRSVRPGQWGTAAAARKERKEEERKEEGREDGRLWGGTRLEFAENGSCNFLGVVGVGVEKMNLGAENKERKRKEEEEEEVGEEKEEEEWRGKKEGAGGEEKSPAKGREGEEIHG